MFDKNWSPLPTPNEDQCRPSTVEGRRLGARAAPGPPRRGAVSRPDGTSGSRLAFTPSGRRQRFCERLVIHPAFQGVIYSPPSPGRAPRRARSAGERAERYGAPLRTGRLLRRLRGLSTGLPKPPAERARCQAADGRDWQPTRRRSRAALLRGSSGAVRANCAAGASR